MLKRSISVHDALLPLVFGLYFIALPANAFSKCDAISGLQRIQTAQDRLASQPARIRASRDRDVLRRELQTLTALNISNALGADISSDERSLIFAILDSAHMFQGAVDHHNTQLAVDIHTDPAFKRHLTQLNYFIPRFNCHVDTPDGKNGPTRALMGILSDAGDRLTNWGALPTITLGILAAMMILIGIRKFRAGIRLQKRRSRRHRIHLPIHFIAHQKIARGILVDISCNGVKLQHNGITGKVGDTLDIWILDDWQKGTIAWANAHYCGVDFAFPILYSQVQALRKLNPRKLPTPNAKTAPEPDAV